MAYVCNEWVYYKDIHWTWVKAIKAVSQCQGHTTYHLSLFAHVQKALPVDKISKVSLFVLNCEKWYWIYIGWYTVYHPGSSLNIISSTVQMGCYTFGEMLTWCYSCLMEVKNVWIYLIFVLIFLENINSFSALHSDQLVSNIAMHQM